MKKYFKIIKIAGIVGISPLGFLLLYSIVAFFLTPEYSFTEKHKFQGDSIYNPYQNLDELNWYKGNFQVQAKAWGGATNGRDNSSAEIYDVYRNLGYDIVGISDYMKINTYGKDEKGYVSLYEHGYGIFKNHQLCFGGRKVNWLDFPLFQTINNKQHVINVLKENNDLVVLAHPELRNAYTPNDLKKLTNYDCFEALNQYKSSMSLWDSALTYGNPVFLLANDDAHNINDPYEVGRVCTFVNSPELTEKNIIESLKTGKSYGARVYMRNNETFEEKAEKAKHLPTFRYAKLHGDTFRVAMSHQAKEIKFIGNKGISLHTIQNTNETCYIIKKNDTYVRTEVTFPDRTVYYLNPIYRYSPDKSVTNIAFVNKARTLAKQTLFFLIILTLIYYLINLTLKQTIARLLRERATKDKEITLLPDYTLNFD